MKLKELLESRKALLGKIDALLENDELTKEQRTEHDGHTAELAKIDAKVADIEAQEERKRKQDEAEQRAATPYQPRVVADTHSGNSKQEDRDVAKFSIGRLIRQLSLRSVVDGIEGEMIQEGAKEARDSGLSLQGAMVSAKAFRGSEARTMTATTGTDLNKGGMTVELAKRPLLDSLFARMVLSGNGAQVLSGLVGNVDLPRVVRGTDPDAKTENAEADEYSPTTAQLSLSPKRVPAFMRASNQLIIQSSTPSIDNFFANHLERILAEQMERLLISGAANDATTPTGLINTTGIGAVEMATDGAAIDWQSIVDLETEVASENADIGSLFYLTNSKVRGKLKTTTKVTGSGGNPVDSMFIVDDRNGGLLNGYNLLTTNVIPSNLTKGSGTGLSAMIFGNLADFVIAQWSGIELLVNPYSEDKNGTTRITAAVYFDGGIVRPQSFAVVKDIATS